MKSYYVGWDLGGAHIKAVVLDGEGKVAGVFQDFCPLWQGVEHLARSLSGIYHKLPGNAIHGLTMTGEMVDLFENRQQGVEAILNVFARQIGEEASYSFVSGEFIPLSKISLQNKNTKKIASINWKVTAIYAAKRTKQCLFIDIGSTTTDFLPIVNHGVITQGEDDCSRLANDELIYTGIVRTPLMTIAKRVPWQGRWIPLMAEYFATTADVYNLLGQLPKHADLAPAADGKAKTQEASSRRLARMLGLDGEDGSYQQWQGLARYFRECQLQRLTSATLKHLSNGMPMPTTIIGAGVGRFLAAEIAQRLALDYCEFGSTFESATEEPSSDYTVSDCAPAAALAVLLREYFKPKQSNRVS